ncbi:MAG: Release factor glutamine methyltransferase [Alphaproteobacteria bacterium MarineAlpha4_Bin2]|nr:MAG: Release factor glutamine methyltransferase [Alphaproteobacteria bacterium MarineAlpha4_Bin2]
MTIISFGERLIWGAELLRKAGIESPRREARLLLSQATGRPIEWILAFPEANCPSATPYESYVARRRAREPMSHILGTREFRSLCFEVSADVLDPRPDSEVLVGSALSLISDGEKPLHVLDLGTGSGCLLLSVLRECPAAFGIGTDISEAALVIASRNAKRLGLAGRVRFILSDWGEALDAKFDVILTNPPYIPTHEIIGLEPEVSLYEPRLALDGGVDGLNSYRAVAQAVLRLTARGGTVLVELGASQAEAVREIFARGGFPDPQFEYDLAGHPRCLVASPSACK